MEISRKLISGSFLLVGISSDTRVYVVTLNSLFSLTWLIQPASNLNNERLIAVVAIYSPL